jgi:hypothetical protein
MNKSNLVVFRLQGTGYILQSREATSQELLLKLKDSFRDIGRNVPVKPAVHPDLQASSWGIFAA